MPETGMLESTQGPDFPQAAEALGGIGGEMAQDMGTLWGGEESGILAGAAVEDALLLGMLAMSAAIPVTIPVGLAIGAGLGLFQGALEIQTRQSQELRSLAEKQVAAWQEAQTNALATGLQALREMEQLGPFPLQLEGGEAIGALLHKLSGLGGRLELEQGDPTPGLPELKESRAETQRLEQSLQTARAQGYLSVREEGYQAQQEYLSGEKGEQLREANQMVGQWQARVENDREAAQRQAWDAMLESEPYQKALAAKEQTEAAQVRMEAGRATYQPDRYETEKANVRAGMEQYGPAVTGLTGLAQVQGESGWKHSSSFFWQEATTRELERITTATLQKDSRELEAALATGPYDLALQPTPGSSMGDWQWAGQVADRGQRMVNGGVAIRFQSPMGAVSSFLPAVGDRGAAGPVAQRGEAPTPGAASPLLGQAPGSPAPVGEGAAQPLYTVTIAGNNFTIREEADVEKVAKSLFQQMLWTRAIS